MAAEPGGPRERRWKWFCLARLSTGVAPGMSAIGITSNKKNHERACALALVISAGVAGLLNRDRQEMNAALWDAIQSAHARIPGCPVPLRADP